MTDLDQMPGDFTQRFAALEPDEQYLVRLAMNALTAGEFDWLLAWQRFIDAGTELVHELSIGEAAPDGISSLVPGARIPEVPVRQG